MLVLPPAADAVVLLREIDQLEVERERPQHQALPVDVERSHGGPQLVARSARPGGAGEAADSLLGGEQVLALLLDKHAPEDVAEQANVAAERRVCVDLADRSCRSPLRPSGRSAIVPRFTAPPKGRGANVKLNPLAPSEGAACSLTCLVTELEEHDYNLIRWAEVDLSRGEAERLYRRLIAVRGLGPKIVPFFLRDVAAAFELDEGAIAADEFLQPIDVWTRRGAQALAGHLGKTTPRPDRDAAGVIVEAARFAGVLPSLLNAGIWCFGSLFALREPVFLEALAEPEALRRFISSHRGGLEARLGALEKSLSA
jgi:hypothetical protein